MHLRVSPPLPPFTDSPRRSGHPGPSGRLTIDSATGVREPVAKKSCAHASAGLARSAAAADIEVACVRASCWLEGHSSENEAIVEGSTGRRVEWFGVLEDDEEDETRRCF